MLRLPPDSLQESIRQISKKVYFFLDPSLDLKNEQSLQLKKGTPFLLDSITFHRTKTLIAAMHLQIHMNWFLKIQFPQIWTDSGGS